MCFKVVLPKVVEHWNLDSARYTDCFFQGHTNLGIGTGEKSEALDCWTRGGMVPCMLPKKKGKKIDALIFIWVRQCKHMELG